MNTVRMAMKNDFVPHHMRFAHLNREDLKSHGTVFSDTLFIKQTMFSSINLCHMDDFRNAGSIFNRFLHNPYKDEEYANTMLTRIKKPNYLATLINGHIRHSNNRHKAKTLESIDMELILFPHLTEDDLELIALGKYQLKQAISYYAETAKRDGDYQLEFSLCKPSILTSQVVQKYKINVQDPQFIRCKLRSRHRVSVKYYTYVLTEKQTMSGPSSIICLSRL